MDEGPKWPLSKTVEKAKMKSILFLEENGRAFYFSKEPPRL
jgi:hypothetical protein